MECSRAEEVLALGCVSRKAAWHMSLAPEVLVQTWEFQAPPPRPGRGGYGVTSPASYLASLQGMGWQGCV